MFTEIRFWIMYILEKSVHTAGFSLTICFRGQADSVTLTLCSFSHFTNFKTNSTLFITFYDNKISFAM